MRLSIVVHVTGTLVRLFGPTLLAPALVAACYREWHDAAAFSSRAGDIRRARHGDAARRRPGGGRRCRAAAARRRPGDRRRPPGWSSRTSPPSRTSGPAWASSTRCSRSMSGLTTTGATVFADFAAYGRGIFFWRALTHWLGGMGVIALFVAVLPRLAIGGRQLFFAEAAGPDRREAHAAASADRARVVEALCRADGRADRGARARRHAAVRRRVQLRSRRWRPAASRRIRCRSPATTARPSTGSSRCSCSSPAPTSRCSTARCAAAATSIVQDEEFRAYARRRRVATAGARGSFSSATGMGVGGRAAPRRLSGGVDHHDDRLRQRRTFSCGASRPRWCCSC